MDLFRNAKNLGREKTLRVWCRGKFFQQFQNEIEIMLSDDNLGELIVKEKDNGKNIFLRCCGKAW